MNEKRALNDKFMLRLPDGMREQIKESAAKNSRSMNAEIVVALELYFGIVGDERTPEHQTGQNLVGLPEEEQLRKIIAGSAHTMYQEIKRALRAPEPDLSNPPDIPPRTDEELEQLRKETE
ncbi:Arc family DNA-binding protein [Shimia sediminis]|uniref:Arc family DNA-binding protein n=1 Tax=Shimia sediminis TaxID=2497945 RepID=UPI000F8C5ABD|nr:Arc family DNA-binding protein [Shimia sediminis]